jgi:hypothetical protein
MTAADFQSTYGCVVDDVELLRLAVGLTIYFSGDITSHRSGLGAAVEAAWPLVASRVRSFQTTHMKRPKATKDGKAVLLEMLDDPPSDVYNYVTVDNRRYLDEAPDCCIDIAEGGYQAGGYFLCRLPAGEGASAAIRELALAIAGEWDFAHGYGGYTLAYNVIGPKAILLKRMSYAIGMRHCGVDLPSAENTSFVVREGIKRINWLTLLGSEMTRRAGSLNGIDREPGVVLHKAGSGLVIQAGERPLIGDTNRRETCEPYRRVGRALKDIRTRTHPAFVYGPDDFMGSAEKTEAWLSSLDD